MKRLLTQLSSVAALVGLFALAGAGGTPDVDASASNAEGNTSATQACQAPGFQRWVAESVPGVAADASHCANFFAHAGQPVFRSDYSAYIYGFCGDPGRLTPDC